MYIDDYLEVLSCLWRSDRMYFAMEEQRIGLWFFEHIAGYSGARPGSLVDASRGPDVEPVNEFDNGASEPCLPTYRDCTLTLLPNPEAGHRGVWVLEVQMNRTKGGLALVKPYDPPAGNYKAVADFLLQQYVSFSFPPLSCSVSDHVLPHEGIRRRGF